MPVFRVSTRLFPMGVLLPAILGGCASGRAAWRITAFEPARPLEAREFHYQPLKVAARGGWVAVLDSGPNLGHRNSRVLLFRKATGALVATSEIPRGSAMGAKGHGLALDGKGRLYVAVEDLHRTHLLRLTLSAPGELSQEWDAIQGGKYPTGIQLDAQGWLLLVDGGNHRIIRMPWKGLDPQVIGSFGDFELPRGLAVDSQGNLYTHTLRESTLWVLKFSPSGNLLRSFAVQEVSEPLAWFYNDLAVDARGRLYLTDYAQARILVLDEAGKRVDEIKTSAFKGPMGLALDEEEHLFVADAQAKAVFHFRPVYEHQAKASQAPTGGNR
jgi:DNA-binding beta-propeller fold protein YncE